MRVVVKVKAKAKQESIRKTDDGYVVSVKVAPVDGRANQAVIKVLAKHLDLAPSLLSIVSGHKSSTKIIDIL